MAASVCCTSQDTRFRGEKNQELRCGMFAIAFDTNTTLFAKCAEGQCTQTECRLAVFKALQYQIATALAKNSFFRYLFSVIVNYVAWDESDPARLRP